MIIPTEDKELKERLIQMFENASKSFGWTTSEQELHRRYEIIATEILKEMEERGYHIGLYPSIEQALNSGDGSYRP